MSAPAPYPTNPRGGWIVPAGETLDGEAPPWSEFGDGCLIALHSEVANGTAFGDACKFGTGCTLGDYCDFGDGCRFSTGCRFGAFCTFGEGCIFDACCEFGDGCAFDRACVFKDECAFGAQCELTLPCTMEGGPVLRWMTLANVDGSGRQLVLILRPDGTEWVRAGCFFGTRKEFVAQARESDKLVYARVVRAVFEALRVGARVKKPRA